MSGWTEYVIADKRDADALAEHNEPKSRWPGFEGFKFFGPPHLAPLYQLLGRAEADWTSSPELAFGDKGWVYEIPPDIVRGLAATGDDRLPELARSWSSRLAAIKERYSGEELVPLLRQMRDLATRAIEADKPMLLWQSSAC